MARKLGYLAKEKERLLQEAKKQREYVIKIEAELGKKVLKKMQGKENAKTAKRVAGSAAKKTMEKTKKNNLTGGAYSKTGFGSKNDGLRESVNLLNTQLLKEVITHCHRIDQFNSS